jgi:hypothetical protein
MMIAFFVSDKLFLIFSELQQSPEKYAKNDDFFCCRVMDFNFFSYFCIR